MVRLEDAIEILTLAEDNQINVWLDGGWGVDALLGEETRLHNDIDLFVEEKNSRAFIELLKTNGFFEVPADFTTTSHTAWQDLKGSVIDLHIFAFTGNNEAVFQGEAYPAAVLNGMGTIGEKTVRCINAESQVRFHIGYAFDENDAHDVKRLCERFNIPLPAEYV